MGTRTRDDSILSELIWQFAKLKLCELP